MTSDCFFVLFFSIPCRFQLERNRICITKHRNSRQNILVIWIIIITDDWCSPVNNPVLKWVSIFEILYNENIIPNILRVPNCGGISNKKTSSTWYSLTVVTLTISDFVVSLELINLYQQSCSPCLTVEDNHVTAIGWTFVN